jgi:hypothetical protein
MTRRTRFSLRETMAQCHDLHPRVARTNGRGRSAICPRPPPACGPRAACRTEPGRCSRSKATIPGRSTSARGAAGMSKPLRLTSSPGGRKPGTGSRSGSRADDIGILAVSTGSADRPGRRLTATGEHEGGRRTAAGEHEGGRHTAAGNCTGEQPPRQATDPLRQRRGGPRTGPLVSHLSATAA